MTHGETLDLVTRLSACSLVVQTLELWLVRDSFAPNGIYRERELREDLVTLPRPLRRPIAALLAYRSFLALLAVQLILCALTLTFGHSPLIVGCFVIALLVCMRFRGTYNGGSDSMTLTTLLVLSVGALTGHAVMREACLLYLAVQTAMSYFLAGVVKLKQPAWRSGEALQHFVQLQRYGVPRAPHQLLQRPALASLASVLLIAFECSFPLALLRSSWALWYLALGFCFHALNAWLFGLNRFWWAWTASYPAVWYASQ